MIEKGIFGSDVDFKERYIPDWNELKKIVLHCQGLGLKIVLTQGTYDLLHVGHMRYLTLARSHGDMLIVGVDSDEKVRKRKGQDRPVVPEMERLEMLVHLRPVTIVTLKPLDAPPLSLVKLIRPDVLVVSRSTKKDIEADVLSYKQDAKEVVVLDPQGEMSASGRMRNLVMSGARAFRDKLTESFPGFVSGVWENLARKKGD